MDNDIKIILTGNKAYDYIRNESTTDSVIENLVLENNTLKDSIEELQGQKDTLEYELFQLKENSAEASYFAPTGRLARDVALAKDLEYKEAMEGMPLPEEPENSIDADWRFFVDTEFPDNTIISKTKWNKEDSEVVENAINRLERDYYSVDILSKYLNRTIASITSKAYRSYGANTKDGMLVKN